MHSHIVHRPLLSQVLEIYNETLRDLLLPAPHGTTTASTATAAATAAGAATASGAGTGAATAPPPAPPLAVRLRPGGGGDTWVPGLLSVGVRDIAHGLQLLRQASGARSTGSTGSNAQSSRGHTVATLRVTTWRRRERGDGSKDGNKGGNKGVKKGGSKGDVGVEDGPSGQQPHMH